MKRISMLLRKAIVRRIILVPLLLHMVFLAIGLIQRGGIINLFGHAYNEPLFIQIIMLFDLPAIFLSNVLFDVGSRDSNSFTDFFILLFFISLQWIFSMLLISWILDNDSKLGL